MLEKIKPNINRSILIVLAILLLVFIRFSGFDYLRFSPAGQQLVLRAQDFITLFLGIIVEAIGFVVLGVSVSVMVGVFVKTEWILKLMPKSRFLSHLVITGFGIFMPVCECGNVPVARRLLQKGFSVSQAITFLLAAPILNPVTFISTWEAFNFDHSMAVWRMVGGFVIAYGVGLLFSYKDNQSTLLNPQFTEEILYSRDISSKEPKWKEALSMFQTEFMATTKMLIIGAFLAALSQSFIPRDIIVQLGSSPILSIVAMLILAFVISICSNVDAFFALSYANTFTFGSLVTFLVFGPMIDIKMLSMMRNTFTIKTLATITLLVALGSILIGLIVNYAT